MFEQRWCTDAALLTTLRAAILDHETRRPSFPSHNHGGWRSDQTLFDWPLPEVTFVRDFIQTAVAEVHGVPRLWALKAWAVVNRRGCYHRRHVHTALWSGIFYLDGGIGSARTIFEPAHAPDVYITPEPGLLVLFPSRTWHSVEEHNSDEPRITIAFDAR